ncbi:MULTISPECIES: hypothetical protein [Mycobacteroides]|uniref:HEAT repeat domain-containing protein n=1 Tax=Mycobacteroides saopaulense TaxID=1578165 RepID=A0ABX3BU03_9MYCO|nr:MULTISPECIES: hypothetical protein [Mycobacteroides]OHT87557.1 hypothetical protein BKG68_05750 [Mycobacteroides saopaulense]OHU05901.1 hypothetical protein BKG73_19895 [Mycobacteroides saopaulense]CPS24436.1 Uncharacterised protein [Mycobacteroides abscessus]CPS73841.1 Uncharacterised protein [Mycobacteroides abscessus]CPY89870.1 Uncharacterised protein [Mycobacteroides abscessus]
MESMVKEPVQEPHPIDDDDFYNRIDLLSPEESWSEIAPWVEALKRDRTEAFRQSHGGNRMSVDAATVPVLVKYLYRIPSRKQQRSIIIELGKMRPYSIDALIQAYRDFAGACDRGGTQMRWYISDAIDGKLNEEQIEKVFGLIDELAVKADADFLLSAVSRTKKQRERAVLLIKEVLETPLGSKDAIEVIPSAAVAAAGRLQDPRLYEPLKALVDTPDKWLRDRVKRALEQCGPKQENAT